MPTWIETSNTHQNGEPVTRKIKIPTMDRAIWMTDNGYAEVSDNVADILANNINSISKTTEPSDPGTYYGDAGENTVVEIIVADGAYDALTVENLSADTTQIDAQLGIPIYSDDTNAPTESNYFNDSEGVLKYKDPVGTVHEAAIKWSIAQWTAADSGSTASVGESIWVDTSSGNVSVVLPSPTPGAQVKIKHTTDGGSGNTCEVSPNGTESIDGTSGSQPIQLDGSYTFESNGSNWESY